MFHNAHKAWDFVAMLTAIGMLVGAYGLLLCASAAKRMPKQEDDYECNGDCLHNPDKK